MSLIETKNLSKEFERSDGKLKAVDDVNISILPGEFVNIIGRSGSGKTTLLNLLSGILHPTSGSVKVEGKNLFEMDDKEKSFYRNDFIGYVPQSLGTVPNINVLDNVRLPHYLFKREGDGIERASILLDWMGLLHMKNEFTNRLSGGELKRVLLARALMNSPKVLLTDELTADLDEETTADIMRLIKKINEDSVTVIMVTHELDLLKYGNRILKMSKGKILEEE